MNNDKVKYISISHDCGEVFDSREAVVKKFMEEVKEKISDYQEEPTNYSLLHDLMHCYENAVGKIVFEEGVLRIDFNLLIEKYPKLLETEDGLFDGGNWLFDAESKYGYRLEKWQGDKRLR